MITGKTKELIRADVRALLKVEQAKPEMAVTYQTKVPKPEDFQQLGWKKYATMRIVR
jgi:hypothetical protein